MKKNSRLEARRKKIPQETKDFVDHSFAIADRIYEILEAKGMEQKDLANALGKKESEISKWLTGTHNFTLKTIAKIERFLGESIIQTFNPLHQKESNYLIIKSDKYKIEQPGHSIDIMCEPQDTYLYSNTEGSC
jgi:transcriptional regulator with XRE-family HTH domain